MIILSTLQKKPDLFTQVIDLIEKEFQYPSKFNFAEDFYPLIDKQNSSNNFILLSNNKVMAHAGVNVKELENHKVALIGGVVVDKKFQGQGMMSQLFNAIFEKYNNEVALFILWSEKNKLYEKYNFFEAGLTIQTGKNCFSPKKLTNFHETTLTQLTKKDLNQIKNLYNTTSKKFLTFNRSDYEWNQLSKITSTRLFINKKNNEIIGYFFISKGLDLPDIIHEIGYLPQFENNMLSLLQNFKLWYPSMPNTPILKDIKIERSLYSALFKVGSLECFNQFLSSYSNSSLKINSIEHNIVNFKFQNNIYNSKLSDFFNYIFVPESLSNFNDFVKPLYISGLDSI